MYKESKELSYILGVFLGDGSVTIKKDSKKGNRYRFSLGSIDKEFVDNLEKNLKKYNFHCIRHSWKHKNPKYSRMHFLTICNKDFVLWLKECTKSKTVVPKEAMYDQIEFVNGLLDSEGWVGKCKQQYGYKYSMGINMTGEIIFTVIKILEKHGVKVGKEYRKTLPSGKITHWFQFNIISFTNSPFKFSINRKNARLDEYLENRTLRDSKYYSNIGKKGAKARWSK